MKNHLLVSLHSWGRGEVKSQWIERSAGQKIEKGRAQKFKAAETPGHQQHLHKSQSPVHYRFSALTKAQMSKRPLLVRLDFNGPDEQPIEQITLPYLCFTAKWANYFLCASTNFTTIFRSPNSRRLARTSLVYCLETKIHNCRSIIFFDFSLQKKDF